MIETALAFVVLTAVLVILHVRRSRPALAAPPRATSCPRCRVSVPPGAPLCPRCGVPPQVFEVVAAPVATEQAEKAKGGNLHAAIRGDVCVGCGACAAACPEPGALTMEGRLAVVHADACKASGECVKACPVNGVFLTADGSVQRVEVPLVDFDFQTNVPGLYVVGELGGRGLIKNAVNEGKLAAEAVARELRDREPGTGAEGVYDVAIVGSGPAGLSAGLECAARGLRHVLLEQGDAAESIRRYPRHKLLLAEPVHLPLYGDLWVGDASKETLLGIWKRVIDLAGLELRTGQKVLDLERRDWGFEVLTATGSWPARRVILAMGRRGSPRKLEVPGEDLPKVFYDVAEMEEFAGRRVLVVGGGDSAIESALGVARQKGAVVHLSYRGEDFSRPAARNRAKLEEALRSGAVKPLLRSKVMEIRTDGVLLDVGGTTISIPNDDVLVRVGGDPPSAFLDKVGVRRVVKELALSAAGAVLLLAAALPAAAQVSPGPLSRPHRQLEGNAQCMQCHGTRKDALPERCLDCHREIRVLREARRGFHGRDGSGACASCHPEHAGEDFALIEWPGGRPESFDHREAGFPLQGKHASLACKDCHQAKFRKGTRGAWIGLEPTCGACHADPHRGQLGAACERCHTPADWKTTPGFDHAATAFPLRGKHVAVACAKCHLPPQSQRPIYKPVAHTRCSECHADPHAGRLGGDCARCHVENDFKQVIKGAFDHDRTRYPLRGAHASVACAGCHDPRKGRDAMPAFATCAGCHADPHRGQATLAGARVDCGSCHTLQAFRPAVLPLARHAPQTFPLTGKHASVPCARCHVQSPQGVSMRPAHARCADCHADPHRFQPARACEPCHRVEGWAPSRIGAAEHAAYALKLEGKHAATACAACHRKQSPAPTLVLQGISSACASCHRDIHAMEPARDCAPCHDARAFAPARIGPRQHAEYTFPLEGAHAAAPCFTCHQDLARPAPRKVVSFQDSRRACADCHEDVHRGTLGRDCARCHGPASFRPADGFDHDRDTRFHLGAAHAPLACAKCHGEGRWAGIPMRCQDCHGPRRTEGSRS